MEVYPKPADVAAIVGAGSPAVVAGTRTDDTLLLLPVTINGYTGIAELDTGSRETKLNPVFARAAGLKVDSTQFHDGQPFYGTSGRKLVPRAGSIESIGFAGVTLKNAQVQVVDLPSLKLDFGDKPAMLLGADLLGRYCLIYDHSLHLIWVRASSRK